MQVLLHQSDYATIALYAGSALIAAVASLFLPVETKGRELAVSSTFNTGMTLISVDDCCVYKEF